MGSRNGWGGGRADKFIALRQQNSSDVSSARKHDELYLEKFGRHYVQDRPTTSASAALLLLGAPFNQLFVGYLPTGVLGGARISWTGAVIACRRV